MMKLTTRGTNSATVRRDATRSCRCRTWPSPTTPASRTCRCSAASAARRLPSSRRGSGERFRDNQNILSVQCNRISLQARHRRQRVHVLGRGQAHRGDEEDLALGDPSQGDGQTVRSKAVNLRAALSEHCFQFFSAAAIGIYFTVVWLGGWTDHDRK